MSWLFLTVSSVVIASIASILQKVLMGGDKSDPYSYAILFHFLLGFLVLVLALWSGANLSLFSGNVLMLLVASALWGVTQVLLFKALQMLEASEVTIISDLRVVVTIIASVILLGEVFSGWNMLGAVLVLGASLLVVDIRKGFTFNWGVLYSVAMALFAGLAIVADSANVQQYDVLAYSTFSNFLSGFCILVFYPKALRQWERFVQPYFLTKMLPLVVLSATQGVLYLFALTYGGNTAQVGTIRQTSVIVTVLLAVIFLKERSRLLQKFVGAILVSAGVLLLR